LRISLAQQFRHIRLSNPFNELRGRSALGNGGLKFALAIIRPHLDTISASRTSLRDRSKKVALVSRLFCGVVGCQGQPGEGIKLGTRCGWAGLWEK